MNTSAVTPPINLISSDRYLQMSSVYSVDMLGNLQKEWFTSQASH